MAIAAKDAYGEIDENAIVELSKDIFIVDGFFDTEKFAIGTHVPMQNSNGQRLTGIVEKIEDDSITMNFNHPLAGQGLHFTGKIIEVRDATEEELAPAMGCGCGSGGCGESSCSTDATEGGCGSGCGC